MFLNEINNISISGMENLCDQQRRWAGDRRGQGFWKLPCTWPHFLTFVKHQALKTWSRMPHSSSIRVVILNSTYLPSRNIPKKHWIQIIFPSPHWENQNMKGKPHLLLKTHVTNTGDSKGSIATNKTTIHSAQMHFSLLPILSSQQIKWCH